MKKKRKLGRKLLGFLLTLVMVLGMFTGIVPGVRVTVNAENSYNFKELTLADLDGKSDFNEVFNALGGLVSYSYPDYRSLPAPSSDSYVRLIIGISNDPDYAYINIYNNGTIANAGTNVSLNNGSIKIRDSMNAGYKYYYIAPVSVNSVSLNKSSTTLTAGKTETLTATVLPDNATDKTVKWSVGGTDSGAVKLYTDENCTDGNEVTLDTATEILTVYAKGISAGSATVTCTSNADSNKSASCDVTVNKGVPAIGDFTYSAPSDLAYDGTAKEATVVGASGMGQVTVKYYSDAECTAELVGTPTDVGTYYVGITVAEGDTYNAVSTVLHDDAWKFTIGKAMPSTENFTYSAPYDLTYDGNAKTATVIADATQGIEGMGQVTVKYYSDAECTAELVGTPTDVGTYYVGITVAEGDNYNAVSTVLHDDAWKFTIGKAMPSTENFTYSAPYDLTYDGNAKTATVVGASGMGQVTVKYYSNPECTAELVGSPTDVGTYYVGITAEEGTSYNGVSTVLHDASWRFTIIKQAAPTLTDDQKPTAKTGLTYTGSEQVLVTAPTERPVGYIEMQYALGTATEATQPYTTDIPTKTEAGTYYVWYKVVGDENHTDTEPEVVKVTIDAAQGETEIKTEVKTDEKSPKLETSDLTQEVAESTLTDEEKAIIDEAVNDGKDVNVDVYLAIHDIADEITAEDKAKLEAEASDAGRLAYFDISLLKEIIVDGSSRGATRVHELQKPLKLTIGVPNSFPAVESGYTRTYVVLRLHNGEVTTLPATVNADGTISFETDRFSVYALVYKDTKDATTTEATTATATEVTTETTTAAASTSDATTAAATTEAAKTSPKTGDSMPIAVLVALMLTAAGMLVFMDLKKKKN